jgi:hypothetical protein
MGPKNPKGELLMDIEDILLNEIIKNKPFFEDDYMKVVKVLHEFSSGGSNYVKRVQLVVWKKKNTDVADLDIRTFSKKDNQYQKGITLSLREAKELSNILSQFFSHTK